MRSLLAFRRTSVTFRHSPHDSQSHVTSMMLDILTCRDLHMKQTCAVTNVVPQDLHDMGTRCTQQWTILDLLLQAHPQALCT